MASTAPWPRGKVDGPLGDLSGSAAASATWVESVSAAWEVMAVLFKTH
jgi:hypothetical protein